MARFLFVWRRQSVGQNQCQKWHKRGNETHTERNRWLSYLFRWIDVFWFDERVVECGRRRRRKHWRPTFVIFLAFLTFLAVKFDVGRFGGFALDDHVVIGGCFFGFNRSSGGGELVGTCGHFDGGSVGVRRLVASLQRLRADVNAARRLQFAGLHDGVGPTPTKETTPIHRLTRTPVDAIFTTVDNQRHTAQSILCKFHVGRHFIPIQFLVFFSNSKGKMATLDTRPNSLEMAVSTEPFSGLFFSPLFLLLLLLLLSFILSVCYPPPPTPPPPSSSSSDSSWKPTTTKNNQIKRKCCSGGDTPRTQANGGTGSSTSKRQRQRQRQRCRGNRHPPSVSSLRRPCPESSLMISISGPPPFSFSRGGFDICRLLALSSSQFHSATLAFPPGEYRPLTNPPSGAATS